MSHRQEIWRKLLAMAQEHGITVDYADYTLEQVSEAWAAQVAGPHAKITAKVR